MNNGWIKLHRKLLEWEWYSDIPTKVLFLHMLLRANHDGKQWKGQTVNSGQFVSGRLKLAKETGLSQQQIRSSLLKLKSTQEVTTKATNKYTVFTLTKWDSYQSREEITTNKPHNKQPTNNQQITTNKNVKKLRSKEEYTLASKDAEADEKKINANKAPQTREEFVATMKASPQRHIQIIAEWADTIQPDFTTVGQWKVFTGRHLKAANSLKHFSDEQIKWAYSEAMKMSKDGKKFSPTLETLIKFLT